MTESEVSFPAGASTESEFSPEPPQRNILDRSWPKPTGAMLSMDFSAPLSGAARAERIKQMSKNHPAYDQSRFVQEVIYKVQTSLRRMPGVSANESNEIITQLMEVGRVVSQETSKLVDAVMNLTLDGEETDKAITRMSLDASLTKAAMDEREQTIRSLQGQLDAEKQARTKAETESEKALKDLHSMSTQLVETKGKVLTNGGSTNGQAQMSRDVQAVIRHLEEQINGRRALWVMKHGTATEVYRALETIATSVTDKAVFDEAMAALRAAGYCSRGCTNGKEMQSPGALRPNSDSPASSRGVSGFSHIERPPTAQPPAFSPLQAGPPRAPSTRPQSRHFQDWGSVSGRGTPSRAVSAGNALVSPTYNRDQSRRAAQGQMRYRPNIPEFQPTMMLEHAPNRPGTAWGFGQDYYHGPSARSRHGGRFQENVDNGIGGLTNGTLVPRYSHGGPLIHLTERSVAEWTQQISNFYGTIRTFVDSQAGMPIEDADHDIRETDLWPILLRTYLPLSEAEAASYLEYHLRDQNSKRCLVTRVIIDYVINVAWVPSAWKGADSNTTYALTELERELVRVQGQPSSARQPLLDRQSAILDSIMKAHEPGDEFYKGKLEEIAGTLLTSLKPLLNPYTDTGKAYRDLVSVAEQAWDLSSKILTSRLTFDFRFPEIGSRFSSQSMVPIWPADVDPMELQARHWRVALVTTPVITCRNDTGSNISAHSVSLADVICMQ